MENAWFSSRHFSNEKTYIEEIMRKQILGMVGAALFISSTIVLAAPIPTNVGVMTSAGTVNCAMTSDGICSWWTSNPSGYDTKGGTTSTLLSSTSSASDARGTAISYGHANMASYLPTLHAYASSNGNWAPDFSALAGTVYHAGPPAIYYTGQGASVADANVWVAQGYEYIGAGPFTLTVTATLSSIFSGSGELGKVGHSGFSLSIFDTEGYVFNSNYYAPSALLTTCPIMGNVSNYCKAHGATVYANDRDFLYDSGTLTKTVSHIVNPGDKFFVGAFLDASVCCGKTVDSSHTLDLAFNDFSQLVSIDVPGVVPEPKALLLFLTGLALLVRSNARPRSAQQA